ncbi:MAG: CapA family protein [Acidimicrobiia bacterium]
MDPRYLVCLAVLAMAAAGCSQPSTASTETTPVDVTITTLPSVEAPTTTAAAPTTSTTTEPPAPIETPRQRLVVSGTGDVNLDPAFVRSFPSKGYDWAWSGLGGIFQRDDLTVINLECSPSDQGTPWNKPHTFKCPDGHEEMAAAGVDVATLANNHGMDFGFEAMLDGRTRLASQGIVPIGTGKDIVEAYEPYTTDINGWKIAVIGSGGVNPETGSWLAREDRPGMTHGDNTESIAEAIRIAKGSADIVLVTAHWGENGGRTVRSFERGQAEAWIDAGADGIFGHHQHVLHPLEFYDGKPIAFGLGNFVWQAYGEGRTTAIAQFVFEPDGRIGACLIPVYIEQTGHPVIQDTTVDCAPEGGR